MEITVAQPNQHDGRMEMHVEYRTKTAIISVMVWIPVVDSRAEGVRLARAAADQALQAAAAAIQQ